MNNFKNSLNANVSTSLTTVYTSPALTVTTVIGFSVANTTASTSVQVEAKLFKSGGGTSSYLIKNAVIPVGGALVIVGGDQKVVLTAGDYIQVKSDTVTSVDVILSVLEIS